MIPLMQKLDRLTPWHVLRYYPTMQEAIYAAMKFAKERQPNMFNYPWYEVNGRIY